MSTLALFLALGGVSYAALALPPGSVGPRQLRNASVTPPKLAFPLGIATAKQRESRVAGGPPPTCGPLVECERAPARLAQVSLHLRARSDVVILASAEVKATSGTGEHEVALIVAPPGHPERWERSRAAALLTPADGYQSHVALDQAVTLGPGNHAIALYAFGGQSVNTPLETASGGELVTVVLPLAVR